MTAVPEPFHALREGSRIVLDSTASLEVHLAVATFVRTCRETGAFVHPVLLEVMRTCEQRPEPPRLSLRDLHPAAGDYLTARETADLLAVSERFVRSLCQRERLPGARREWCPQNGGESWRIPRSSVLDRVVFRSLDTSCSAASPSTAVTNDDPEER